MSTAHSTSTSPASPPTSRMVTTASSASVTLPATDAIAPDAVRRLVADADEVEAALGHRVVRRARRLDARVAEEVAAGLGVDGGEAPEVVALQHGLQPLVVDLLAAADHVLPDRRELRLFGT